MFKTSKPALAYAALIALCVAVFGQVIRHEFINLDTVGYVTGNTRVQSGISAANIQWAFTTFHANFWHPLTWLSHMLDCQLFGLSSGWHHLSSLILHTASTLLLMVFLHRATGALWASAATAVLFAAHPLHVESVAWVAERKDVLSTFFMMLTLLAYRRYAARPLLRRYLTVLALFVMGLMAKPMLVTLPCLLLLCDWWPLGRIDIEAGGALAARIRVLVLEKLPFFALSLLFGILALIAQGEAVVGLGAYPIARRLAGALYAYVFYLAKMIWPLRLAVFYPLPAGPHPLWQTLAALALLASVSALAWKWRRRHPFVLFGWLWYLITLLPVCGLIQVGAHAVADRYTYVPLIGPFVAVAWSVRALVLRRLLGQALAAALATVLLATCAVLAWGQVRYWQSNLTLYRHAIFVARDNFVALNNLGEALCRQGAYHQAAALINQAVQLQPRNPNARYNLAETLFRARSWHAAVQSYQEAINLDSDRPRMARAHCKIALALEHLESFPEARGHYHAALKLDPGLHRAHLRLGALLAEAGQTEKALEHIDKALHLVPGDAEAYNIRGTILAKADRLRDALKNYTEALRLKPGYAQALKNRDLALEKLGRQGQGPPK